MVLDFGDFLSEKPYVKQIYIIKLDVSVNALYS